MAVKSNFASGDVLTAADVNTYLTNGGLVWVAGATIGTSVSSVPVTNCFSGTYDAYKIVVTGGVASANGFMKMVLGSSITGYYQTRQGLDFASGLRSDGTDNNAAAWTAVGTSLTTGLAAEITLINVNYAKPTICKAFYASTSAATDVVGIHQVNTAYTGFTISPSTGTWTGGYYNVYGFRMS